MSRHGHSFPRPTRTRRSHRGSAFLLVPSRFTPLFTDRQNFRRENLEILSNHVRSVCLCRKRKRPQSPRMAFRLRGANRSRIRNGMESVPSKHRRYWNRPRRHDGRIGIRHDPSYHGTSFTLRQNARPLRRASRFSHSKRFQSRHLSNGHSQSTQSRLRHRSRTKRHPRSRNLGRR